MRVMQERDSGRFNGIPSYDAARKCEEEQWSWEASATGGDPRTYRMAFPTKGGPRSCPVKGCLGRVGTQTVMRMHFCSRHVRDIVIILEEGNLPHPRCS